MRVESLKHFMPPPPFPKLGTGGTIAEADQEASEDVGGASGEEEQENIQLGFLLLRPAQNPFTPS